MSPLHHLYKQYILTVDTSVLSIRINLSVLNRPDKGIGSDPLRASLNRRRNQAARRLSSSVQPFPDEMSSLETPEDGDFRATVFDAAACVAAARGGA